MVVDREWRLVCRGYNLDDADAGFDVAGGKNNFA